MVLNAPKLPINILFFVIGAICIIGFNSMTTSIEVQANANLDTYKESLINSLSSCGEIVMGKDVYMCVEDIVIIAEKIVYENKRINELNKEYKVLKNDG